MLLRVLKMVLLGCGVGCAAVAQPPPDIQKMMAEVNSRPRYYWCAPDRAQFTLHLVVKVDGSIVGRFQIPVAKAERNDIPIEDPQKVAEYHFRLAKRGNRKFRGVSNGKIEGNFWIGLATDTEIDLGHSWVCGDQIILHEMLPFVIGKPDTYESSGVRITATWRRSK